MISWLSTGLEYSAADVAIEDINSNPDILPNTILGYSFVNHNLDVSVSTFLNIFEFILIILPLGCSKSYH